MSGTADNALLEGNTITHNYYYPIYLDTDADGVIIRNNTISNTFASASNYGIYLYSGNDNLTIEDNTVTANRGIYQVGSGANILINRNKVISYSGNTDSEMGIYLFGSGTVSSNEVRGYTDSDYAGIYIYGGTTFTINNNTLVNNGIGIKGRNGYTGTATIKNNIIAATALTGSYRDESYGIWRDTTGTLNSTYNQIFNCETTYGGTVGLKTEDQTTSPRFVNPGVYDYRIFSDSPCSGTADPADGGNRGAYETVAASSGITSESYVRPDGDDNLFASTPDAPWQTLGRALSSTEGTVYARGGTYTITSGLVLGVGQQLKNYLTETVTIDSTTSGVHTLVMMNYTTVEGVTIRNAYASTVGYHAVTILGTNATLKNCVVVKSSGVAASRGIYLSGTADNALLSGNIITHNYSYPISLDTDCDSVTISGNTISNSYASASNYGIYLYNFNDNLLIEGNTITANKGINQAGSGTNLTVRGNKIISYSGDASSEYGLYLYGTGTISSNEVRGYVDSDYAAIYLYSGGPFTINNNTIVKSFYGIRTGGSFAGSLYSTNNIIVNKPDGTAPTASSIGVYRQAGTVTSKYDDVWNNATNWSPATISGVGTISADPVFLNAAGNDYHLIESSPCIGTGTPEGTDMGAYDYQTSSISLEAPNGGESWGGLTYNYISWESGGYFTLIDLYYSIDNGAEYTLIVSGEADDGLYQWYLPAVSTTEARVKIIGFGTATVTDESDAAFTISTPPPPTVSSIDPETGLNNQTLTGVTISGSDFQSGAAVKLTKSGKSDIEATGVSVVNTSTITCNLNLTGAAVGDWNVVVTNSDTQSDTLTNGFTIIYPPPTVTSVSPESGPTSGGTGVTINGSDFIPGSFERAITVYNGGTTLTDYQLLVTMETAPLVANGKMRSDCGDIRFLASDEATSIPYWFESGVNTSLTRIWVKVPSLPAGTSEIYVTYGDSSLTSQSDGDSTFIFFDDFNRPDGTDLGSEWGEYGSDTSWQIVSNTCYRPTGPGDQFALAHVSGSIWSTTDAVVESKILLPPAGTGDWHIGITARNEPSGSHYGYKLTVHAAITTLQLLNDYSAWGDSKVTTMAYDEWWTFRLKVYGNNQNGYAWKYGDPEPAWDGTWPVNSWSTHASGGVGMGNINYSGSVAGYFDDFRVRQYAATEPIAAISSAETSSGFKVYFGTIEATNIANLSSTTFTATTPANVAGAVDVTVVNVDNQAGTLEGGFTYTGAPTVTLLTPNGGEIWQGGTYNNITWETSGTVSSVNLYYSLSTFESYAVIATGEVDDGVYSWLVPNQATTEAKVKIEVTGSGGSSSDESDAVFAITNATSFYVDPSVGDNSYNGLTSEVSGVNGPWRSLTYAATQSAFGNYLYLNPGTYNTESGENFPITLGNRRLVGESSALATIEGTSPQILIMSGVSTVEGCTLRSGSTTAGSTVVSVESGSAALISGNIIEFSGAPPANGRGVYVYNSKALIDGNLISNVAVGVRAELGGSTTTVESNTIVKFSGRGVENLGDTCYVNNTIISSSPEGTAVAGSYGIYSEDGTTYANYNDVYLNETNYYHTGSGGLTNTGPVTLEAKFVSVSSGDYHLLSNSPCINTGDPTESDADGSRKDIGLYYFDLSTGNIAARVIQPNGGETLTGDSAYEITWYATIEASQTIDRIELAYSIDNGLSYTSISTNEPNDGTYSWTVPNITTTEALVRIGAFGGSNGATDESESGFSITGANPLNVVYVDAVNGDNTRTTEEANNPATPWKTITYASTMAATGYTINVKAGNYNAANGESFPINVPAGIRLFSETALSRTATIDSAATAAHTMTLGTDSTVEGFTIKRTNTSTSYFVIYANNKNTGIVDNTITGTVRGVGIYNTGNQLKRNTISCGNTSAYAVFLNGAGDYTTVEGNTIAATAATSSGLYISDSTIWTDIQNNLITAVYPINARTSTDNLTIKGNTLEAATYGIYFYDETDGYLISNNTIVAYGGSATFGIKAGDLGDIVSGSITSNEVRGFSTGLFLSCDSTKAGICNVYHNTIAETSAYGLYISAQTNATYNIKNNIIVGSASLGANVLASYGIYSTNTNGTWNVGYNDVWNYSTNYYNYSPGDGELSRYPRFVSSSTNDLRLLDDSPCAAAGEGGTYMGRYPATAGSSGLLNESWVDANLGSDSNSGTELFPFKSITHALATTEYTVQVKSGLYDAANGEIFPISPAGGQQLISIDPPTTSATIDGGSAVSHVVKLAGPMTLEGFTVRTTNTNTSYYAVYLDSGTVTNSRLYAAVRGVGADAAANVIGNRVYMSGSNAYGVYLPDAADNCVIEGNTIEALSATSSGIYLDTSASGTLIRNNNIRAVFCVQCRATANGSIISGNTLEATTYGVHMYDNNNGYIISNNTIIGPGSSGQGIVAELDIFGGRISFNEIRGFAYGVNVGNDSGYYTTVESNTVVNNKYGLNIKSDDSAKHALAKNNLVCNNYKLGTFEPSSYGILGRSTPHYLDVHYNLVWNNTYSYSNCVPGTGNISSFPKFVSPEANDFRIFSDSPAATGGEGGTFIGRYSPVAASSEAVESSWVDSTTGLDSNLGTSGSPFKTIAKALTVTVNDINVNSGVYDAANGESFPLRLAEGQIVRSTASPNYNASVDGGSTAVNLLELNSGSTLEGMGVKTTNSNTSYYAVSVLGAGTVTSCSVEGNVRAIGLSLSTALLSGTYATASNASANTVYLTDTADGSLVSGNSVYAPGATAFGIYVNPNCQNIEIRDNTIEAPYTAIRLDDTGVTGACSGFLVTSNRFWGNNTASSRAIRGDGGAAGQLGNGTISSNEARGYANSISVDISTGYTIYLLNNTLTRFTGSGLSYWAGGSTSRIYARNNIICSSPESGSTFEVGSYGINRTGSYDICYASYNDVWNVQTPYYLTTNVSYSISQDPLFFNSPANNFRLATGSPCIDTGTPEGSDMGAYQYDGPGDITGPTVEVTSPISSESWQGGSVHEITFTATDESGIKPNSLWIWYSTDEGSSYPFLITSEAEVSSPYAWTVPEDTTTTEAMIKVSLQDNSINQSWGTAESGTFTIEAENYPTNVVYVNATTGDNNRTTTEANNPSTPWKTITYASTQSATGTTINVAAGTYNSVLGESFPVSLPAGVKLNSSVNSLATIDADSAAAHVVLLGTGSTIEGFTIISNNASTSYYAVYTTSNSVNIINNTISTETHGIRILGSYAGIIGNRISVKTAATTGILFGHATDPDYYTTINITDNTVEAYGANCNGIATPVQSAGQGQFAYATIARNKITMTQGSGHYAVYIAFSNYAVIERNIVTLASGAAGNNGLYLSRSPYFSHNMNCRNNTVEAQGSGDFARGIYYSGNGNIVSNEVIGRFQYGIFGEGEWTTHLLNVRNNSIVRYRQYGIYSNQSSGTLTLSARNNIVSANPTLEGTPASGTYGLYRNSGTFTSDYNDLFGNQTYYGNVTAGENDTYFVPRFVDAGNNDLRLYADSVCIGAGEGGINIGAYLGTGEGISSIRTSSYVSGGGSDTTGDGSSGNPWRSITYAMQQTEKTINLMSGTFDTEGGESFPLKVRSGQNLYSVALPSTAATIDAAAAASNIIELPNYGSVEGFSLVSTANSASYWAVYGTSGISIRNLNISASINGFWLYGSNGTAVGNVLSLSRIGTYGIRFGHETDGDYFNTATITDNYIRHSGTSSQGIGASSFTVGTGWFPSLTISRNTITMEGTGSYGIYLSHTSSSACEYNRITLLATATSGSGIRSRDLAASGSINIRYNTVEAEGSGDFDRGIYYCGGNTGALVYIASNEVAGRFEFAVRSDSEYQTYYSYILNNTIVGFRAYGVYTYVQGGGVNATIKNNIISAAPRLGTLHPFGTYGIYRYSGTITSADYNDVWGNENDYYSVTTLGGHNLARAPKLVDYPSDLRLYSDSPCIGAGENGTNIGAYKGAGEGVSEITAESYVSGDGNNETGDGSASNPWRSLTHALARTEYKVNAFAGTYDPTFGEIFPIYLSEGQLLVSAAVPTTMATISAGSTGTIVGLSRISTLEGFSLQSSGSYGAVPYGDWGHIINNTFNLTGSGAYGVYLPYYQIENTLISNNIFNMSGSSSRAISSAVWASGNTRPVGHIISRNQISLSAAGSYGMYIYFGSSLTFEANSVTMESGATGSSGFYTGDYYATNYNMLSNLIQAKGSGDYGYGLSFTGSGVIAGNEISGRFDKALYPRVEWTTLNVTVNRNTLVGYRNYGLHSYQASGTMTTAVTNCIICANPTQESGASGTGIYKQGGSMTVTYSDVYGNATNYSGVTSGVGTISAVALFADPASFDYHLTTGSPCDGTGTPEGTDMGAYDFTAPLTVTLHSPNGGESWQAGTNNDITWETTGTVSSIDLYYSIDGGTSYTSISAGEGNDGVYSWLIPNEPTTEAKVKIEAVGDGIATDESAGIFTLLAADNNGPTIEVTSPVAGDKWQGGSIHEITYTATDESRIKPNSLWIWYSTDEGSSYPNVITSEAETDSPFSWTLPSDLSTTDVKIKVSLQDNSSNFNWGTGESGSFTIDSIPPVVTIGQPDGGETLTASSTYEITWTATDNITSAESLVISLYYTTSEAEIGWLTIATNEANDGSYIWAVPTAVTTEAKVKALTVDEVGWTGSDESTSIFTIEAGVEPITLAVTLESPNGGENWITGLSYYISWETSGSPDTINLYYTTSEALGYQLIEADLPDDSLYFWMVPDEPTTEARVRVVAVKGLAVATDESDAMFTIEATSLGISLRDASDTSDYSTWEVGAAKQLNTAYIMTTNECVVVKNEGNVSEDFSLTGATTNWTLSATGEGGTDKCLLMGLFNGEISPTEVDFSTTNDIITGGQVWGTGGHYEGTESGSDVASGSSRKFYIYLRTPIAITSGAEERITATIGCRKH